MANLHKLTVQEALNAAGPGGVWTVNAVGTAAVSGGTSINLDVSSASQLGILADGDIYFNFSTANGVSVSTANDLTIPGTVLTFITVPGGLGKTIYFNYLSTSATVTRAVRTVEI